MTLASEHESIAIARDCHVSVLAGVSLSGASPVYAMPPFNAELGVGLPPTPNEVSDLLRRAPRTRGLVVTMPTYHGLMGDVEGIVRVCHERGVVVMVDEAHGPHFRFLRHLGFPVSAEDAGADVVTQSTHKVLAALNQASLLHFNNVELVRRYEELQAPGFQSTSFSYPLLLSIEQAIEHVTGDGLCAWSRAIDLAERFRDGASRIAGIPCAPSGVRRPLRGATRGTPHDARGARSHRPLTIKCALNDELPELTSHGSHVSVVLRQELSQPLLARRLRTQDRLPSRAYSGTRRSRPVYSRIHRTRRRGL